MTKYVKVPQRCLHRITRAVLPNRGPYRAVLCRSTRRVSTRIHPGDSVVVIGPGPIGLLCVMMAKLAVRNPWWSSARQPMQSDLRSHRISCNPNLSGNRSTDGATDQQLADGCGAGVVIDAAGVRATLKTSIELVRPGGQIVKVGWVRNPAISHLFGAESSHLAGKFQPHLANLGTGSGDDGKWSVEPRFRPEPRCPPCRLGKLLRTDAQGRPCESRTHSIGYPHPAEDLLTIVNRRMRGGDTDDIVSTDWISGARR